MSTTTSPASEKDGGALQAQSGRRRHAAEHPVVEPQADPARVRVVDRPQRRDDAGCPGVEERGRHAGVVAEDLVAGPIWHALRKTNGLPANGSSPRTVASSRSVPSARRMRGEAATAPPPCAVAAVVPVDGKVDDVIRRVAGEAREHRLGVRVHRLGVVRGLERLRLRLGVLEVGGARIHPRDGGDRWRSRSEPGGGTRGGGLPRTHRPMSTCAPRYRGAFASASGIVVGRTASSHGTWASADRIWIGGGVSGATFAMTCARTSQKAGRHLLRDLVAVPLEHVPELRTCPRAACTPVITEIRKADASAPRSTGSGSLDTWIPSRSGTSICHHHVPLSSESRCSMRIVRSGASSPRGAESVASGRGFHWAERRQSCLGVDDDDRAGRLAHRLPADGIQRLHLSAPNGPVGRDWGGV